MQALESIEEWDIRAYVRSTARKCGVNIDNLPKGEVVPFVRPLKGVYELSEEKLRECKTELAEVEEAENTLQELEARLQSGETNVTLYV